MQATTPDEEVALNVPATTTQAITPDEEVALNVPATTTQAITPDEEAALKARCVQLVDTLVESIIINTGDRELWTERGRLAKTECVQWMLELDKTE